MPNKTISNHDKSNHDRSSRDRPTNDGSNNNDGNNDSSRNDRPNDDKTMLEVKNLSVQFNLNRPRQMFFSKTKFNALSHVSFSLKQGRTLGIVGESGSGKTTLARAMLGLLTPTEGSITHADDIIIGRDIQFVFQDPLAALNPRMRVEQLILEPLSYGSDQDKQQAQSRLKQVMQQVGLDYLQRHRYAHEFSGGQCQRIGIARAMITEPKILICDEPVSALDVSIRAQIINLLKDLQSKQGLTLIFIAHDLSLVRFVSDELLVMYQGRVVEQGETETLFSHPKHPYTQALISAEPKPDPEKERQRARLEIMDAEPGNELACAYVTRCKFVQTRCGECQPELLTVTKTQKVACFFPLE